MKKYLLPQNGTFYKANLHCHSVCSDGEFTPAELKEIYKGMGYSVLAITDHDILVAHDELNDNEFITLHGFEMEVGENKGGHHVMNKCCHMCSIAIEPDNMTQPCWHRTKYTPGIAQELIDGIIFDESKPDFEREYSTEGVSRMMTESRNNGYFVTYNHPSWSRERYPQYMGYNGMHAMEMFNGMCIMLGYEDYNPRVYEDMLEGGKRIYCIGSDDNHNHHPQDSSKRESGLAWTMIKAPKLEYREITRALEQGNFYASEGPEINELWIDDEGIHIRCSDAVRIDCNSEGRAAQSVVANDGETVSGADFEYFPFAGWFRLTVTDKNGKHACTNAYFPDEL